MKHIKTAFLLVVFSFCLYTVKAQFGFASWKDVGSIIRTKTYFVLHDSDEIFNRYITIAAKEHWNFTKYECIHFRELNKYSGDTSNTFIIASGFYANSMSKYQVVNYTFYNGKRDYMKIHYYDKSTAGYTYGVEALTLVRGGKEFNKDNKKWLAFCYLGYEANAVSSAKLICYVHTIQNTLQLIRDHKLSRLYLEAADKLYSNAYSMVKDTLIMDESDIPSKNQFGADNPRFRGKEEMQKLYTLPFVIVGTSEIEKYVLDNTHPHIFLGSYYEGTNNRYFLYTNAGKILAMFDLGRGEEHTDLFKWQIKRLCKKVGTQ